MVIKGIKNTIELNEIQMHTVVIIICCFGVTIVIIDLFKSFFVFNLFITCVQRTDTTKNSMRTYIGLHNYLLAWAFLERT